MGLLISVLGFVGLNVSPALTPSAREDPDAYGVIDRIAPGITLQIKDQRGVTHPAGLGSLVRVGDKILPSGATPSKTVASLIPFSSFSNSDFIVTVDVTGNYTIPPKRVNIDPDVFTQIGPEAIEPDKTVTVPDNDAVLPSAGSVVRPAKFAIILDSPNPFRTPTAQKWLLFQTSNTPAWKAWILMDQFGIQPPERTVRFLSRCRGQAFLLAQIFPDDPQESDMFTIATDLQEANLEREINRIHDRFKYKAPYVSYASIVLRAKWLREHKFTSEAVELYESLRQNPSVDPEIKARLTQTMASIGFRKLSER